MYREESKDVQGNFYWSAPRVALALLMLMLAFYGIGFLATGGDLAIYRFWAPKQENARRVVFEQTQSYVEGKIGSLSQERLAYESAVAGSAQQKSLRTMIITEASTIDNYKLPADLRSFIVGLKGGF
jgi:hypothetical protein